MTTDNQLVAVDRGEAIRFFPEDPLEWKYRHWPMYIRRPVYYYLFMGAADGKFTLTPDVGLSFAKETRQTMKSAWFRNVWTRVFSLWSEKELRRATGLVDAAHGELATRMVELLDARLNALESEFHRLYYFWSEGLW